MSIHQHKRENLEIGVAISETWQFFEEIYADLSQHYPTTLFKKRSYQLPIFHTRINRYLFLQDLAAFMRRNDVVFFEWASELLAGATQLRKQSGIVTRLHRYEMYYSVNWVNWEAVDKIILVSQAKKQEFIDRFPEQAEKIVVIPEAVDVNKFQPQDRTFNGDIGILCNLTPRKRIYELILCFYELTNFNDGLHLHIGGGSVETHEAYFQAIQDLVDRLDLGNKVTLYGNVSNTPDWYHNIDIFVSNSYSEGLQVAPMEAMASGCFCLSHHWSGADELLPGENLFLTDSELQKKILDYCETTEENKKIQRELLRSWVCEKFDIDKTKVQIREIIKEVGSSKL